MKLNRDRAMAGVLEPVFAIRTEEDLGIGDTDGVRQMIDWCHQHGFNIFQTLPINETSEHHSPYDAISSLAIDPSTIAISPRFVPDLPAAEFGRLATPTLLAELRAGTVNYNKVKRLKMALLQAAFGVFFKEEFSTDSGRAQQFRAFLADNAEWLPDYSLFRVLMVENGHQSAWDRWPAAHQTPTAARAWLLSLSENEREALIHQQHFFMYVQWLAFAQWQGLKSYGEARGVYLMGDIPFGVGLNSADIWANRDLFEPGWSGGAPPEKFFKVDKFTEKWGQNWGVGIYRWDEMKRRNYKWWRMRVENIRKVFHFCRIDHVPGFFRLYSFPWPPGRNAEFSDLNETEASENTGGKLPGFKPFADDTPEHKAANQQQGEEALRAVVEAARDTVIVAEDLGLVPEYVRPTLKKIGIPGYCIPSFFREYDGRYANPAHYPRLGLAQPATHDHAPLAAAWEENWQRIEAGVEAENHRRELRWIMRYAGIHGEEIPRQFTRRLREAFFRSVLQSNSWLVVVMITDVFGLQTRFNTPGSVSADNWSQRLPRTVKQMDEDPAWLDLTQTFARLVREARRAP